MAECDSMVQCGCCGEWIKDTPEENVHHGMVPYPDDVGFGECKACGGDPESKDVKKKMGWAMVMFCEARFDTIRKSLNENNRKKWDECSWEKKCLIVLSFVEKGYMI